MEEAPENSSGPSLVRVVLGQHGLGAGNRIPGPPKSAKSESVF